MVSCTQSHHAVPLLQVLSNPADLPANTSLDSTSGTADSRKPPLTLAVLRCSQNALCTDFSLNYRCDMPICVSSLHTGISETPDRETTLRALTVLGAQRCVL